MNDVETGLWLLLGLAIPLAFLIFVLIVQNHYLRRRVKKLRAKLDEADQRHDVALLGFDPAECEKHHLPGDCPLCGAK